MSWRFQPSKTASRMFAEGHRKIENIRKSGALDGMPTGMVGRHPDLPIREGDVIIALVPSYDDVEVVAGEVTASNYGGNGHRFSVRAERGKRPRIINGRNLYPGRIAQWLGPESAAMVGRAPCALDALEIARAIRVAGDAASKA